MPISCALAIIRFSPRVIGVDGWSRNDLAFEQLQQPGITQVPDEVLRRVVPNHAAAFQAGVTKGAGALCHLAHEVRIAGLGTFTEAGSYVQ